MFPERSDHLDANIFSIIIPTLNSGATISKALASIQAQSFLDYEVIVIDGVSDDDTASIVKTYAQANPRIKWVSEKDEGIYFAMNKGIQLALGKWIFFLGSDDYLFSSDVLATVHENIVQNRNVEMVYGNVWLSEPMSPYIDTCLYGAKYTGEKLLRRNICHQCIFYQRKLFKRFGLYKTNYVIFGDWDFNLRIFNKIKSLYIDKVIAFYNIGGLSGKSHHLDNFFGKDFLENMATHYSYSYRDAFFNNRKKELFQILLKQIGLYKFLAAVKISRILAYQVLPQSHRK
ncbi:MAG: glycosyltransferase [Bacteroidota bacterium]|nr:glycosyltransferase [Bacteroidota bacterium]